eukprot:4527081-Ditylum_brightwellii.AAC.1
MQSAAQELYYDTGIVNNAETTEECGIQDQTADALQALTTATADDRHAVANLCHANMFLNDQSLTNNTNNGIRGQGMRCKAGK